MTTTRTEEVTELAVLATKAADSVMALEAAHRSDPSFDAAMILFRTTVQVGIFSTPPRHSLNCRP